jgi:chromosome segregation ATPase
MKWPFVSRKRHVALLALAIKQNEDALERQLSLIDAKRAAVRAAQEQTTNAEAALKAMTENRNKWRDKAAKCESHIETLEARIQEQHTN